LALLQRERLEGIVSAFRGKNVLVVGDLMVDKYISIIARKLSREAPVPVGDLHGERMSLGGAGNLVSNIIALGGKAEVVGFVGNDEQGKWIVDELDRIGVDTKGIEKSERPTTLKTRYVVNGFQYLRIDREIRSDIGSALSDSLLASANSLIPECDMIAIADYDKGTITSYLVDTLVANAKNKGKRIVAQPKVRHYMDLQGVDYIKSNEREASIATGVSVMNESSIKNIATNLSTRLECKGIVLTRGERGITVFDQNTMTTIPPLLQSNEFARPVGVRDAMTSVITLALASGANLFEAAALSNLAAAKRGESASTIVVRAEDILRNLGFSDKILSAVTQVPVRR
jgi:D-glycero-beta-D-manno-heptose-7-phosphate kinase